MFQNIFSKASELSKKAKNIANQYLANQYDPNIPVINEEKIRNMIKDIDNLKDFSLQEYEKKIAECNAQIDNLKSLNTKLVAEIKKLRVEINKYKSSQDDGKKTDFENEINSLKSENQELLKKLGNLDKLELNSDTDSFKRISFSDESIVNLLKIISDLKTKNDIDSNNLKTEFNENLEKEDFISVLSNENKESIKKLIYDFLDNYNTSKNEFNFTQIEEIIQKEVDEIKKLINDNRGNLNQQFEEIFKENKDLRQTMNIHISKNEEMKQLLEKEKNKYTSLFNKNEELEKNVIISEEKTKELKSLLEKLKAECLEFKNKTKTQENHSQDNLNKIKNYEGLISEYKKQEEKFNMKFETAKQALKNIFFIYLDEEVFMDTIEKCFKSNEINIEEMYRITKYIKINFTRKIYNFIINDCIKSKIKNKTLKIFNEINGLNFEFNNLDQLKTFSDKYMKTDEHIFLLKLFGDIIDNCEIQSKSLFELTESNKKLLIQNEEIMKIDTKLQSEMKELFKSEKYLKDTIENLNNNINFERTDKENTLKSLKHSNEELDRETYLLKEKLSNLTQKCNVYKIENQELIEKYNIKTKELCTEKDKHEVTLKEKNSLQTQINEVDKLKNTVNEKTENLLKKDIEIEKLRLNCQNIQNLLENYKDQHENFQSNIQLNLTENAEKYLELENNHRILMKENEKLNFKIKTLENLNDRIAVLENENKKLKDQKYYIKKQADDVLQTLKLDLKDSEFYLDKRIISRFVFKYFDKDSNESLKYAVLDAFANFFGYNNDERKAIGLKQTNFISSNTNLASEKIKLLMNVLSNFILNL